MTLQASTIVYFLLNVVQELMTLPCDVRLHLVMRLIRLIDFDCISKDVSKASPSGDIRENP